MNFDGFNPDVLEPFYGQDAEVDSAVTNILLNNHFTAITEEKDDEGDKVAMKFSPWPQQVVVFQQMEGGEGHRCFGAMARQGGKSTIANNFLLKKCSENNRVSETAPPRYMYVGPTIKQARMISWPHLKAAEREILTQQPEAEVFANKQENTLYLPGGKTIVLGGAKEEDSLRGGYLDGVVIDEYAFMSPRILSEIIEPQLIHYGGWIVVISTPCGRNHFYDAMKTAHQQRTENEAAIGAGQPPPNPSTGYFYLPASQIKMYEQPKYQAFISSFRKRYGEFAYQQEYECSFDAPVPGTYYAEIIQQYRSQRVVPTPFDPNKRVITSFDLGVGDKTAIWWAQLGPAGAIKLIDYEEATGKSIDYWMGRLRQRETEMGYTYQLHILPHDADHRQQAVDDGTGGVLSRTDLVRRQFKNVLVCPKIDRIDGIDMVRSILPMCWFNSENRAVMDAVSMLSLYRSERQSKGEVFSLRPVHDWTSDCADSFRYLAVILRTYKDQMEGKAAANPYHITAEQEMMNTLSRGYLQKKPGHGKTMRNAGFVS